MTRFTLTIITALAALITNVAEASSCSTKKEARTLYPTQYISYRIEGRRPGGAKCWFAPGSKSSRGGVESRRHAVGVRSSGDARPAQESPRASVAPGPRETVYAGVAESRQLSEKPEEFRGHVRNPAPYDRIDSAFTTINHFTTMPWHDDLWLRMQTYWLFANYAQREWVVAWRWP